jgi:hypothetical protein
VTTTLTGTGWTGLTTGIWTHGSNTVTDNLGGVVNIGIVANTLGGKDSITGSGGLDDSNALLTGLAPVYFGIENLGEGEIIMGNGKNSITGTAIGIDPTYFVFGIYNENTIAMGNGNNNSITGTAKGDGYYLASEFGAFSIAGIYNRSGTITIGNGNNNSITGTGIATGKGSFSEGIFNRQGGTIAIGNGNNNSITGIGGYFNGIYNRGTIKIGNGNNNSIAGTGIADGAFGIYNQNFNNSNPTIEIGNGNNTSIIGTVIGNDGIGIYNEAGGTITMGNGTGTISGKAIGSGGTGIFNAGTIDVGGGNDLITGIATDIGIYNSGVIDAGSGNDKLLSSASLDNKVTIDGDGIIKMGLGNDYFQGFGSQSVFGGSGKDTLDLGAFNLGVGGLSIVKNLTGDNSVSFIYNGITMETNQFESFKIAGNTYSYSGLPV